MVIIIDAREKMPYKFPAYQTMVAGLRTGDYSIKGLEDYIAVERKSLDDFVGCCTANGRDRFKAELLRLKAYSAAAVIIEGSASDIWESKYRSEIKPNSVMGSIASWGCNYKIPFILAGNRESAQKICEMVLSNYYRKMETFLKTILLKGEKNGLKENH